jgi:hypothetical protein
MYTYRCEEGRLDLESGMPFLAKILVLLLFLGLASANASHAQEATADYVGPWKQVNSNAGRCDRCEIDFLRTSGQLTVKSNNGWTAQLRIVGSGRGTKLEGHGTWSASLRGNLRGERFEASFQLIDNELHLLMKMINPSAKPRLIKGVFQRHWVGS